MAAHDDAIMLGEALDTRGGASQITFGFLERYGAKRVIETPISENALVGMALGAAVAGLRVVAEVYSADFLFCAGSEVVNDIAKWRYQHHWDKPLRLVLRMPAGLGRLVVRPQHTQSSRASSTTFRASASSCPALLHDARRALVEAVEVGDPVSSWSTGALYDLPPDDARPRRASLDAASVLQGRVVMQGDDVTVVAWGAMQHAVRQAAAYWPTTASPSRSSTR